MSTMMIKELKLIEEFKDLNLAMELRSKNLYLETWKITNEFLMQVQEEHQGDAFL